MARTRKKTLYIDTETSYGSDPSANGSGYAYVPALEIGELQDTKALLETNYFTGRNFDTAPVAGRDGWTLDVVTPLIGLSAAAGDGGSPPADDWLDALLLHTLGAQTQVNGEGVASVGGSTSVTLDTDIYDVQQVIAVHEDDIPSALGERTQFALITVDGGAGAYTISPAWVTNPTGAAVAYGSNMYSPTDAGGNSLALHVIQDDVSYTLLGARCTSARIVSRQGEINRLELSFSGDSKTAGTKASLPAVTQQTLTPTKALLSPFWFAGTSYATHEVTIDLGITAAEQPSTAAVNGRAGFELIRVGPTVTVQPLFADALQNLKRNVTLGRLLVQLGAGVLSGGVINALAFHAEEAHAVDANPVDENGRLRAALTFKVSDKVEFSSGVASRFMQLLRV